MQTSAFDDASSAATDATYAAFGVPASYIVSGGSVAEVKVLVDDRSRTNSDRSGSRSRVHTLRGSVRVSQVTELGRGDTIQIDGDEVIFKITPNSITNDGLEWSFEATAEATNTVGDVRTIPQT